MLWIPVYSSTQHGEKMLMKVGNWLMIDDVTVEKIQKLPGVSQTEKKTADSLKTVYECGKTYGNFRILQTNKTPQAATKVKVSAEKDAFRVAIKCYEPTPEKWNSKKTFMDKNNPWKDVDLAEIFFCPAGAQTPIQFFFFLF